LIEGEARDGVRRVFSDSWKLLHLVDRSRETPVVSIHHSLCCGVEISCAHVIAEALPDPQNVIFGSAGECSEIRKSAEPFVVIGNDGGDLSLLEHELRDEDGVWVARSAPGEVAAMAAIPAEKRAAERANVFRRNHSFAERRTQNAQRPTSNSELSVER